MTALEDVFEARLATRSSGLLRQFNEAGVLATADVHVALRLGGFLDETDESVLLAAALAVRGPRLGHVFVDLRTIATTATVDAEIDVDVAALPWPEPDAWRAAVAASPLSGVGENPAAEDGPRPLRLAGSHLYLDRYWREERQIAADLASFAATPPAVDDQLLADGLARVFAGQADGAQIVAAASAVLRRVAVVAGGPGTGKTTTVARIAALLCEQATAAGRPLPLMALAAPTGKAAARLGEAVHAEARKLDVAEPVRQALVGLDAVTLHRLLGWRPGSNSRFRHHRGNRLAHDIVIVDETSMVGLSMMSRLVESIRPDARLILVGDPGQLSSIEAGAVLGDIVGPSDDRLQLSAGARSRLSAVVGREVVADEIPADAVGDGIVVLDKTHRFDDAILGLATAIRAGDADQVIAELRAGGDDITWLDVDVAQAAPDELAGIRSRALAWALSVRSAALAGDAEGALKALGEFRVLCAHRRGDHGAATWVAAIEGWLQDEVPDFAASGRWYIGRPLLVTENDYGLKLFNGDTGVIVATATDRVSAAFERRDEVLRFAPSRLSAVETVYAMTIHKSQGSQFGTAAVVLPDATSRILTRELLYTAVTRAVDHLIVAGTEQTIREAVARPIARASGLRGRLWEE